MAMRILGAFGAPWRDGLVWSAVWLTSGGALVLGGTPYGTAAGASFGGTAAVACLAVSIAGIFRRRKLDRPAPGSSAAPAFERFSDLRERVRNTVHALDNSLCRIAKATRATQDIAARTNLLALDSMIATARFAQAGKGFSPAAAAARAIAGETRHSMAGIGEHIRDINDLAASVSATIDEVGTVVSGMEEMVKGVVPDPGGNVVRIVDRPGRRQAPVAATEQSPP